MATTQDIHIEMDNRICQNGNAVCEETEQVLISHDEHDAPFRLQATTSPEPSSKLTNHLDAHGSLQSAKDRAQITASTSMSIVHVVLLYHLLSNGPKANEYYFLCLTLIISALAVQVITGLVALYISFLRKYLHKYKSSFASDFCENMCPLSCNFARNRSRLDIDTWINADNNSTENDEEDNYHISSSCCPLQCDNSHFTYNGQNILNVQDDLQKRLIQVEVQTADIENRKKDAEQDLATAKYKLRYFERNHTGDEGQREELQNKVREAELSLKQLTERDRKSRELRAKCIVLQQHVDAIRSEVVLKQAECWQNIMNVMLYVVFILNAFIAGFGIGGHTELPC